MEKGKTVFNRTMKTQENQQANKGRIAPTPECRACEAVACKGKSAVFFDCRGEYLGKIPRRNLGLGAK